MHQTRQFTISGMDCASCVNHIEKDLKKVSGVHNAVVNFATEKAAVTFDDEKVTVHTLVETIKKAGYLAVIVENRKSIHHQTQNAEHLADEGSHHEHDHARSENLAHIKNRFKKFLIALFATLVIVLFPMIYTGNAQGFILLVMGSIVLYAGKEFFTIGFPALIKLRPGMDTLVALGVGAAFVYSTFIITKTTSQNEYFMDVGIITTFILLGRYLEARAKGKASEAIKKLLGLTPKEAHKVETNGSITTILAENIHIDDILLIKPGEKIPVDGVITFGTATIDESMITGESIPVDKNKGDAVIGATINGHITFKMRAKKVGKDTVLSHIIKLVETAQMSKAPIQKLVEVVSHYFVWGVIAVAIITFIAWIAVNASASTALIATVAVLIIACPCALGLATPISIVVGSGRGASAGILIKNSEALEKTQKITTIAFDKTGTITKGKPDVHEWIPTNSHDHALLIAFSLETHSEHPLANAIVRFAIRSLKNPVPLSLSFVKAISGKGIVGKWDEHEYRIGSISFLREQNVDIAPFEGKIDHAVEQGFTVVGFAENYNLEGLFLLRDEIKETSAAAVAALKKKNIKTVMLTGDNKIVASAIGKEIGIDEVYAECMPSDKVRIIQDLQRRGEFVAMAGDGINDSPALASADVGIAMGHGSDIAMETGEIILVQGDLSKTVEALQLSRATLKNIKQNLFWAFGYNTLGIPVAAFGLLNPKISAAAMALSSISVVLNALRLKKISLM